MILHPQGRVKTFQRSLAALCLQFDSSPEMPPNWLLMRHPPGQAPRGAITDGQMTLSDLRGGPASRGEKQGPGRDNGGIRASENSRFMLALVAAGTRRGHRLGRMLLRQLEDDGDRRQSDSFGTLSADPEKVEIHFLGRWTADWSDPCAGLGNTRHWRGLISTAASTHSTI